VWREHEALLRSVPGIGPVCTRTLRLDLPEWGTLSRQRIAALVAQRLKRTPSIISKLKRFDSMELARMQDIGGLRAVVRSLRKARDLEQNYRNSSFKHELVGQRDYIAHPPGSGYRSVHLIYRYRNDRAPEYDGLLIELQIRTRLQHAWATAVETMGTFLNYALKSSEGPKKWLDFFALTSSAFAHLENCPAVPGYNGLSAKETFQAVEASAAELDVRHRLQAFTIAANAISRGRHLGSYHLVVLDLNAKTVTIRSFGRDRLEEANLEYTKTERRIADGDAIQAVLVSAGPVENLRRAYPNYFLDTREFVNRLNRMRSRDR
jgi:putative GTP pyrophosphokinase